MTNNWVEIFQYFFQALAIVSAVAVVWVSLKYQTQKITIEQLRELVDVLKDRLDGVVTERAEDKVRIERLEQEKEVLRSIVTGEAKVNELSGVVHEQHRELMDALTHMRDDIKTLTTK